MMLETHMKFRMTEPDFLEKNFPKKVGKMNQKGSKTEFFEFIEKFIH